MVILCLVLYGFTLGHQFVYDDKIVIEENTLVKGGPGAIPELWTSNYLHGYDDFNDALYRPLSTTVFNVIYSIAGHSPWLFHLVNVLFYTLLVVLAYRLFMRLFPKQPTLVFWACALFAAHPVHTEVVANVKSLDEILALLCGIAASIYALRLKEGWTSLAGALGFFLLALFSKESAISFTLIIPLLYYFHHGPEWKNLLRLFVPLAVLGAAWYGWHEYVVASMPRAVDKSLFSSVSNSVIGIENDVHRVLTGLWIITKYFTKIVWPWPLYANYSFNTIPTVTFSDYRFYLSVLFLGGSAFIILRQTVKRSVLAMALLVFFIAVMPTANLLMYIGTTFAERLVFTPSLAFIPLVVALKDVEIPSRKWVFAGLLAIFSVLTVYRAAEWRSYLALFEADVQRNPASFRTHYNYATALIETVPVEAVTEEDRQNLETAIVEFNKALEMRPDFADAILNLGNAYKRLGQMDKALEVYNDLIPRKPDYAPIYFNKGIVLYMEKDYAAARESFLKYTQLGRNTLPAAWYWAGVCSGYLGDFEKAIEYLNNSLALDAQKWEAWNYLGMAYGNTGQWQQAVQAFEKAYEINPTEMIEKNLGHAVESAGGS